MRTMTLSPLFVASLFVLGAAIGLSSHPAGTQAASAWTVLFDGSNLDNWNTIGNANWRLADGVVEATSGSGFLVSKSAYTDFELRLDVWVDPAANSGVFIRCSNPTEITAMNAYEVNIFDMRPDPTYRTGAIVNVARPMSVVNAGNRWNTLEIMARGPRLTVRLNDLLMVDVQDSQHPRGPIALQYGAGTVRFRNVHIRS